MSIQGLTLLIYCNWLHAAMEHILLVYEYCRTGSIGYGDQPDEPFSTLVILVLVIGLGIPAILTVLAIGFVFTLNIYKWHKSRRGYRRI